MNHEEFILIRGKNKSPSTVLNYKKALKKLDLYLASKNINESQWMYRLRNASAIDMCVAFQEIINHIQNQVSPRVTKEYFEIIESYMALNDLEIPAKQRKARISFPKVSKPRFEGLDQTMIKRVLEYDQNPTMRAFYSGGYGAGIRETELLLLTPSMIRFNETPYRIILPKEITKFSIPRETFIAKTPGDRIKNLIYQNHIRENQTIFDEYDPDKTLIKFEKHFAKIRHDVGYDTPNRQPHQQNDITLHSFRSFFTTVFMDNGLDWFGLAITGHSRYMDTYFRKSLSQRQITFQKIEHIIDF